MQKTTQQAHSLLKPLMFLILGVSAFLYAEPEYQIIDEHYTITGRTRESELVAELGSDKGMRFASMAELKVFVQNRSQRLENLRSFKKSTIEISYPDTIKIPAPGDSDFVTIPVILEVNIEDGKAFVSIPYAFYNSNEGLMAGMIFSAPNISGTFRDLLLVGLYTVPPDENDQLQWTAPNFLFMGNLSGIRLSPFTLGFSGTVMKMNQTIESRGIPEIKSHTIALSGAANLSYPLSDTVSDIMTVQLAESPESTISYTNDPKYLVYGPISSSWKMENKLAVKRYDWKDNFRNGYKAALSGSYTSTTPRYAEKQNSWLAEAEFAGYYAVNKRLNPSFRVYSFINSGLPRLDAGQNIRGIRNSELKGNVGIFLNTSLQIFLLRFGNAELHVAPALDCAYVYVYHDPDYRSDYGFGAGSELMLIFDSMKNLPLKLGFAYDLRPKSRNGSGKYYEVDFSFNFTY